MNLSGDFVRADSNSRPTKSSAQDRSGVSNMDRSARAQGGAEQHTSSGQVLSHVVVRGRAQDTCETDFDRQREGALSDAATLRCGHRATKHPAPGRFLETGKKKAFGAGGALHTRRRHELAQREAHAARDKRSHHGPLARPRLLESMNSPSHSPAAERWWGSNKARHPDSRLWRTRRSRGDAPETRAAPCTHPTIRSRWAA